MPVQSQSFDDFQTPHTTLQSISMAHGDADTVVPIDVGRRWAKTATDLKMKDFKYMELPGADHATVITQSMPAIFEFFKDHAK